MGAEIRLKDDCPCTGLDLPDLRGPVCLADGYGVAALHGAVMFAPHTGAEIVFGAHLSNRLLKRSKWGQQSKWPPVRPRYRPRWRLRQDLSHFARR